MKVLILEDEIPAYQKLTNCLVSYFEQQVAHDWARSIADGRQFLFENSYDFILSDIQLLDGVSFDLFDEIHTKTPIIFCSAYDNYLFKAFNSNGIAYILKPYTQEVFNDALHKYHSLFDKSNYNNLNMETILELKKALKDENKNFKKRFVIKKTKGIRLLNVTEISLIQASGDFCIATDFKGNKHPISQTLSKILSQLNPAKFFKINRSEIVSIEAIENIENHFKNRLLIRLKGYEDKVTTTASTTAIFRKWLED